MAARNPMNVQDAIDFVQAHGVVLESARGPVPSLVEAIAGAPVTGSWWSHPQATQIFQVTRAVRASERVLVCRLVAGKITYVHQRLWPSIVRVQRHFPFESLARICEQHSDSGKHVVVESPFPEWIPVDVALEARHLPEDAAYAQLQACIPGVFG
jgi:hypothetical protein